MDRNWGRLLCTDRFKYSVYDSGENRIQLVDLKEDPGEMINLAGQESFRETKESHQNMLRTWIEKNGDRTGAAYV